MGERIDKWADRSEQIGRKSRSLRRGMHKRLPKSMRKSDSSLIRGKTKGNWSIQSRKRAVDTLRYRDVYEDQQLERANKLKMKSAKPRRVMAMVVGLFVFFVAWMFISVGSWAMDSFSSSSVSTPFHGVDDQGKKTYDVDNPDDFYTSVGSTENDAEGIPQYVEKFYAVDDAGNPVGDGYASADQVPEPQWHKDSKAAYQQWLGSAQGKAFLDKQRDASLEAHFYSFTLGKFFWSAVIAFVVFLIVQEILMRQLKIENLRADTSDINENYGDQHIALPEEVMEKFDFFPDAGAHSSVQVSSLISHVALSNKGINSVAVSKRYPTDIVDAEGNVDYYAGEIIVDDNDNPVMERKPMFDQEFMKDIFEVSEVIPDYQQWYNPERLPYNPGNENRSKLKGHDTVADLVNGDWEIPSYESQRPAGAYIVDTDPVNTLVC